MLEELDYSGEWYLPICDGEHRLYVLERGVGSKVLALHGGPGHDHGYLRDALAPLETRHRVVYFDQRGSLRSPAPLPLVTFDAIIEDTRRLVDEVAEGPLPVVAHSMGGIIAAAALSRHPGLFANMLLVNPGRLSSDHRRPTPSQTRPEVEEELRRLGLDRPAHTAKEATWAWRIRFAGTNLYHVDRWRKMGGGMAFYRPDVGEAVQAGVPEHYDYVPPLQAHPHPVTILVGDHDFVDPAGENAQTAAGGAVQTVVVAEAGHNLWIDQPERFNQIADEALRPSV